MLCQASERCWYLVGITLAPAALLERIGSQLHVRGGTGGSPGPSPYANPQSRASWMGLEGSRRPLITPADPPGPSLEVPSYLDGSWTALLSFGVCLSVCCLFYPITSFLYVASTCSLANAIASLKCTLQNTVSSAQSDILHITPNASKLSLRLLCAASRLSAPRVTESLARLTF